MNPTQHSKEAAEKILAMMLDRTSASLTIRHVPQVIQAASDKNNAELRAAFERRGKVLDNLVDVCACLMDHADADAKWEKSTIDAARAELKEGM